MNNKEVLYSIVSIKHFNNIYIISNSCMIIRQGEKIYLLFLSTYLIELILGLCKTTDYFKKFRNSNISLSDYLFEIVKLMLNNLDLNIDQIINEDRLFGSYKVMTWWEWEHTYYHDNKLIKLSDWEHAYYFDEELINLSDLEYTYFSYNNYKLIKLSEEDLEIFLKDPRNFLKLLTSEDLDILLDKSFLLDDLINKEDCLDEDEVNYILENIDFIEDVITLYVINKKIDKIYLQYLFLDSYLKNNNYDINFIKVVKVNKYSLKKKKYIKKLLKAYNYYKNILNLSNKEQLYSFFIKLHETTTQ